MFREMRRKNQDFSREICMEILDNGLSGVLALLGDGDYPYAVPLNYARIADKLYFHCAREGHKVDAIRACPRASFCVIDADAVSPEEYSTLYRSVITFGRVRMVEEEELKRSALMSICEKYVPGRSAHSMEKIHADLSNTGIIEFTMEHISGKESRTLAKQRRENQ